MAKPFSELTLYSEEDFEGESCVLKESDINLKKSFNHFVKSAVVKGNPWALYEKEQNQGGRKFLEEGCHSKFSESLSIGSAKSLQEELSHPELFLYSSTEFHGEVSDWEKCEPGNNNMKAVSVGEGGVWGIRAKDDTVWMRVKGGVKYDPNESNDDGGESWSRITGGLRQVSVGANSVWGINGNAAIIVRVGIGKESPGGKEWVTVDGESMKHVSVSGKGHVWAVDSNDKIWYRKGASSANVLGSNWKMVPGCLKQISIGHYGVWGINANQEVWYRLNTATDPDNEGTGWVKVDGRFQQIFVGPNRVLALAGNRDIYYRSGLNKSDTGTHWIRIEQDKDSKIVFKQVECYNDNFWCVDKDNNTWFKSRVNEDIGEYVSILLNGDSPNFRNYAFPSKAASYKVRNGGWALYSEPNFQGKVMYQCVGDCFSNDPVVKESPLKSWFHQIGSARPIRGTDYRTPIVKLEVDWSKKSVETCRNVIFTQSIKNDSTKYTSANWNPTYDVRIGINHSFKLTKSSEVPNLEGVEFDVSETEPFILPMEYPVPDITTSEDFHKELHSFPFVFKKGCQADRKSERIFTIHLPCVLPPQSDCKIRVVAYKSTIKAPVTAEVKSGFLKSFDSALESQTLTGTYSGLEGTYIRIEYDTVNIPQPRKISKMLNGLGVLEM